MTNPRELIARLNVPAARYEIGRGGIPELSNIDIAGALGMMEDDFAREVFCALWWPDGARLTRQEIGRTIFTKLIDEWVKREREIFAAKLEMHILEGQQEAKRFLDAYDKQIRGNVTRRLSIAKARHWPWNAQIYSRIGNAVVDEKRFPARCRDCEGRGHYRDGQGKITECERCHGTGVKARPNVWRASQLGIADTTFGAKWTGIYEWTVRLVTDAEASAAAELKNKLGFDS